MNPELEARIWDYLDRTATPAEVAQLERDLLDPQVARELAKVLMMRELLRDVGPEEAPSKLVARLERAVLREGDEVRIGAARGALSSTLAALRGLGWSLRGPGSGLAASLEAPRGALSGIGTTRWALGPLAESGRNDVEQQREPRSSWWRRVLRLRRSKEG